MAFTGEIGHLSGIESPFSNAGGTAKTTEDVLKLSQTGVGYIEDGSQTLLGRIGNAFDPENIDAGPTRVVYYHNPETGETFNSLGMPGKPVDVWVGEIPEKVKIAEKANKKFIQNVAPVSEDPLTESIELLRRSFEAGAHGAILNAGCPNVVNEDGTRHELLSRDPDALAVVLFGLKDLVDQYMPIWIRISPQTSRQNAAKVSSVIRRSGVVSAVLVPNTWPNHVPKDKDGNNILGVPGGGGGLSGPATADASAGQTAWLVDDMRGSNISVISSSGITNATELKRRLDTIGADAGAGTTFFYEPVNGWKEDTDKLLTELAA